MYKKNKFLKYHDIGKFNQIIELDSSDIIEFWEDTMKTSGKSVSNKENDDFYGYSLGDFKKFIYSYELNEKIDALDNLKSINIAHVTKRRKTKAHYGSSINVGRALTGMPKAFNSLSKNERINETNNFIIQASFIGMTPVKKLKKNMINALNEMMKVGYDSSSKVTYIKCVNHKAKSLFIIIDMTHLINLSPNLMLNLLASLELYRRITFMIAEQSLIYKSTTPFGGDTYGTSTTEINKYFKEFLNERFGDNHTFLKSFN